MAPGHSDRERARAREEREKHGTRTQGQRERERDGERERERETWHQDTGTERERDMAAGQTDRLTHLHLAPGVLGVLLFEHGNKVIVVDLRTNRTLLGDHVVDKKPFNTLREVEKVGQTTY